MFCWFLIIFSVSSFVNWTSLFIFLLALVGKYFEKGKKSKNLSKKKKTKMRLSQNLKGFNAHSYNNSKLTCIQHTCILRLFHLEYYLSSHYFGPALFKHLKFYMHDQVSQIDSRFYMHLKVNVWLLLNYLSKSCISSKFMNKIKFYRTPCKNRPFITNM